MLKLISKTNCPRCENIKTYLDQQNIKYEVEMAEDKGYEYWRNALQEKTGVLGFPILIRNDEWVNGSSEEIINKISDWLDTKPVVPNDKIEYDWGIWK